MRERARRFGRCEWIDGGAAVGDVVEHAERDEWIGRCVWVVVVIT
jgi:hypothetical protein